MNARFSLVARAYGTPFKSRFTVENRLVSSASLSLLSFAYSEPRDCDSFNPLGMNIAELPFELKSNSLFLGRRVGDEDNFNGIPLLYLPKGN